jgi:hypothetical protein
LKLKGCRYNPSQTFVLFKIQNHENKTFSLAIPLLFSCSNQDDDYVNLPLDFSVPSNFPDLAYD